MQNVFSLLESNKQIKVLRKALEDLLHHNTNLEGNDARLVTLY